MLYPLLAAVGACGATIEVLPRAGYRVEPGGKLMGAVTVRGGKADQRIDGARLDLVVVSDHHFDGIHCRREAVIATWRPETPEKVRAGESVTLPFEIDVPCHAPVTMVRSRAPGPRHSTGLHLRATLELHHAVDASHEFPLAVSPQPLMAMALEALEDAGYAQASVEILHRNGGDGFVEEFRHVATGDRRPAEVHAAFTHEGGPALYLQADRGLNGGLPFQPGSPNPGWVRVPLGGAMSGEEVTLAVAAALAGV